MLPPLDQKIAIPEGVSVEISGAVVKAKGPKGESKRELPHAIITISKEGNIIVLHCKRPTKREKTSFYSMAAHIKNLLEGVKSGFVYKVKVCSSHFPMSVTVEKDEVVIKNFLGEKIPRKSRIMPGSTVKIDGSFITIESVDKESAANTAANIEQATRITNRDRRIFQDGCFLVEKAGKKA